MLVFCYGSLKEKETTPFGPVSVDSSLMGRSAHPPDPEMLGVEQTAMAPVYIPFPAFCLKGPAIWHRFTRASPFRLLVSAIAQRVGGKMGRLKVPGARLSAKKAGRPFWNAKKKGERPKEMVLKFCFIFGVA